VKPALLIGLVFLVALTAQAQAPNPPTSYTARTDMNLQAYPATPFSGLTGANTCATPTDFSNPIMRVTDTNTKPDTPGDTYAMSPDGSAEPNLFNVDSSLVLIGDITRNSILPMTLNFATCTAARMYVSSFPTTGGMVLTSTAQEWSRTNPNILYQIQNNTQLVKYDFTNRSVPPTPQLIFDFHTGSANCLPAGINSMSGAGITVGDGMAGAAFGTTNQDNPGAIYIAVFKFGAGGGCRMWNLSNGAVTGDWGPTGTMTFPQDGTSNKFFEWHNAKLSKDGSFIYTTWKNCTSGACGSSKEFYWNIATLNSFFVTTCPNSTYCPSHQAADEVGMFFLDANGRSFWRLPFSNVNAGVNLTPTTPVGYPGSSYDVHISGSNAAAGDLTPACMSSFNSLSVNVPPRSAWDHEIFCISPTVETVWRMAHTFNSDGSSRFTTSEAIGGGSQDGLYFGWSTDMFGNLGSEGGSSSCTVGGSLGGTNCRGDVFIVKMPAAGGGGPAVSFNPTSITFAGQPVNSTSGQQSTTLTNTGTASLTVTSVTLTGTNSAQFALVTPLAGSDCRTIGTVLAGSSCVIAVTFTPNAIQTFSANISVADNAAGSPQTVALTGTGIFAIAPVPQMFSVVILP
jgi:hypothetical protein